MRVKDDVVLAEARLKQTLEIKFRRARATHSAKPVPVFSSAMAVSFTLPPLPGGCTRQANLLLDPNPIET
jgi:hypothetical protein